MKSPKKNEQSQRYTHILFKLMYFTKQSSKTMNKINKQPKHTFLFNHGRIKYCIRAFLNQSTIQLTLVQKQHQASPFDRVP